MADAAAARREARRRRILENSHNRLQLISGKNGDECLRESPIRSPLLDENYELPVASESSSTTKSLCNNGVINSEAESFTLLSPSHDVVAGGDSEVANDLAAFAAPTPEIVQTPSFWEKLTTYKYDIVLLSLFIQLLYSMSLVTLESTYFFLPVIVYIVTKIVWFPPQNNSNIANVLLLLNGISPSRVRIVLSITQYLGLILQDIGVYLFTTICTQSLYMTIKDNLIT